ncbi:unnamed protein product [Eruca vesicaria subsp. sativa]|uniref:Uncharacterized protein n=1 Tax=Eruca vesicaria subsp. sativa TaxID=29727 RepID=A0ABC8K578_ERUVS|nr:unnamed protein product [Eruca vesicaria subsp. sativa]
MPSKKHATLLHHGVGSPIFTGVMALVMGVFTMIRVTKNVPRKLTESTLYSSPMYCDDASMNKSAMQSEKMMVPAISREYFMAIMKRMAELEQEVKAFFGILNESYKMEDRILSYWIS